MKIDKLEHLLLGNSYVVRLTTDTGITGIGQSAFWGYPEATERIVNVFKDYLIGQNPLRIKGKHFDVPVWELLGGNCRDKIRLHLLAGGPTPEKMYDVAKAAKEEGFTALKFDPLPGGYQNQTQARLIKTAVDITAAAREACGPDVDLIIEVHRKLTPMVGIALGEALKQFELLFIEDPIQIDTITTQADIAKRLNVPIANGERFTTIWEFRELLEHGGPQYVRPDIALAGGITHCKKIAAIAESYHSAVVTHNFLTPIGTAASLHLDTSIPNFVTQEYTKRDEAENNAIYKCAFKREGGYIPIPQAPGLGVELDDTLIAQTPFAPLTQINTPLRDDGSVAYAV